jgi:acetoin:2,6-dichlorophenolindophenol oxidoreductase subunit alpha
MLDRVGGICGGKSGSMHLSDRSRHFLGASSIVASQLSVGAGAAMAEKASGSARAVVAFCGDGALGAGVAYETLMIALRRGLPLLLMCEDNGWQDHTPSEEVMPARPATLLPSLGLPTQEVDGNDVLEVATAAKSALDACRAGDGPQAVVARTYLRHFHSQAGDDVPDEYRPAEEAEYWLNRDPVELAASRLRAHGVDPDHWRTAAVAEVDHALVV